MIIAVYFLPPLLYHPRRSFVRSFVRSFARLHLPIVVVQQPPSIPRPTPPARRKRRKRRKKRGFSPASRRHSLLLPSPNKTLPHSARGEGQAGGSLW